MNSPSLRSLHRPPPSAPSPTQTAAFPSSLARPLSGSSPTSFLPAQHLTWIDRLSLPLSRIHE